MDPLVSILIPAYKAERFIADTIRSCLAQTWARKEIIVVDDGSPDNTFKVAKTLESKEVKVITQPNGGATTARNKAFANCQGDFIQWLDADDLLAPDKIATQLSGERRDDRETMHNCKFGWFYARPTGSKVRPNALYRDYSARDWLLTALGTGAWVAPHTWLMSRQLAELAGPWDDRLRRCPNDDGEYFCRVVSKSRRVKFHDTVGCFYRTGMAGSLSHVRSNAALTSIVLSVNLSIDHLLSLGGGPEAEQAAAGYLQYSVFCYQVTDPQIFQQFQARARTFGAELKPYQRRLSVRAAQRLLGSGIAEALRNRVFHAKLLSSRAQENLRGLVSGGAVRQRS
jgi:glycosyltransferase involved in cell wall biosynthesis